MKSGETNGHRWYEVMGLGGLVVVSSAFLSWVSRGAGSTMNLRGVGDLLLGGSVEAVVPRWVGAIAYLIPAQGALLVVAAAFDYPASRRSAWALLALLVLCEIAAVTLPYVRNVDPSWGQLLCGVGISIAFVGLFCSGRKDSSGEATMER